jgi:putative redox protein
MLLSGVQFKQLGRVMQVRLKWVGGAAFVGETAQGHKVVIDGPPEGGGRELGPRPMEMLLLGLGACTSYDVVSILRKARQEVLDCRVELKAVRADEPPKVFTTIHVHFIVIGSGLQEKQVERAIRLSAEKYCSASIMLGKTAEITHSWEVQEAAG